MLLKEKTKLIRLKLKLSQRQFAKIIGSNQTEVSFIERGFVPEDVAKIQAIEMIYRLRFANDSKERG